MCWGFFMSKDGRYTENAGVIFRIFRFDVLFDHSSASCARGISASMHVNMGTACDKIARSDFGRPKDGREAMRPREGEYRVGHRQI